MELSEAGKQARVKTTSYPALIIPGLLLFFLISTTVQPVSFGYNLYNDKRILEIIVLALVIFSGLLTPAIRRELFSLWQNLPQLSQWLIPSFFALGAISALLSPYPLFSLTDVALHLSLLTATFILATSYLLEPQKVLKLAAAGVVTLAVLSIFIESVGTFIYWSLGRQPGSAELFAYFTHPRFFNQMQSWLLPAIFLLPMAWPKKPRLWLLTILAASSWWALMFVSGGRGSILGLITATVFISGLTLLSRSRQPLSSITPAKFIRYFVFSLFLGIALFFIFISIPNWFGFDPGTAIENSVGRDLSTFNGRISIWKAALTGTYESPFFGVGPGLYSCLTQADWYPAHPHNGYIQILSEWGILASFVFVILVFAGIRGIFSRINKGLSISGLILFTSLVAAATHMSLSGLWVMPAAQISGVLICGLLLGWVMEHRRSTDKVGKRSISIHCLLYAALLAQIVTVVFLFTSLPAQGRIGQSITDDTQLIQSPGFWFEGLVCRTDLQDPES